MPLTERVFPDHVKPEDMGERKLEWRLLGFRLADSMGPLGPNLHVDAPSREESKLKTGIRVTYCHIEGGWERQCDLSWARKVLEETLT